MRKEHRIKIMLCVWIVMMLPLLSVQIFGQGANAALSGTVLDPSKAMLPGATIKAVNMQTGIVTTTVANSGGIYNFPSLQPGVYEITAELQGFQSNTKTDVKLVMGVQSRLNFDLSLAVQSTVVQVISSAENALLDDSSSTGTLLPEKMVADLPLVGGDVMDILNAMGGVVKAENPIFSNGEQTFAGVQGNNVSIQRDGIRVNEVRYSSGIVSPTHINPEIVGEMKVILSPVDAEMGHGAGQVHFLTKSGANNFHGSAVWNIQNSALDANEWENKNQTVVEKPNWRNLNNYTLSFSGPIIKNKTFFFATWDQQMVRARSTVKPAVLTPCARKGIFRYMDGWINGNVKTAVNQIPGSRTRPVVDETGIPVLTNPDGSQSQLRYQSVLGQLTDNAKKQIEASPNDCAQFDFSMTNAGVMDGTGWNTYRNHYDRSGYIDRFSALMPSANDYEAGDGLNIARHAWTRSMRGGDSVFGSGMDNERKSLTIKIDHNLNNSHRLSGTYTYESDYGEDAEPTWPSGFGGSVDRQPQSFSINVTSTLSTTLLNELRFGLSRTRTHTNEPLTNPSSGSKMAALLKTLLPTDDPQKFPNYTGYPIVIGPGAGNAAFWTDTMWQWGPVSTSNPYGSRGNLPATWGGVDPRWTLSDMLTWTKGAHSFKGGFDYTWNKSWQETNGAGGFYQSANTVPSVQGGVFNTFSGWPGGELSSWQGMVGWDGNNFNTGNYATAYNMMSYMAGSVGNVRQWFYSRSAKDLEWNRATNGELNYISDLRNREFSLFFQDSWKMSSSFTLILGGRWEYYGIPWVESGMAAGIKGGSASLFGVSGGNFKTWMPETPVQLSDDNLTQQIFIGPNSPNVDEKPFNKDLNNFGPVFGFAWQVPWFGKGKTTLRGGYQLSYSPVSNFDSSFGYAAVLTRAPGTTYQFAFTGDADHPYVDFENLGQVVPLQQFLPSAIRPMSDRPLTDRSQTITVYDQNIQNPYTQRVNLSMTRNVGNALTVDVRYIGTLSRKMIGGINLNSVNFINNHLLDAFKVARAGGASDLLDRMIPMNTLVFGSSGAAALRAAGTGSINQNLANGDFAAVAGTLSTTNGILPVSSGIRGAVLRSSGQFPENFIYTNPQYASATLNTNLNHANYHSLQAQVTLRPTRGINFQTTYTWSRNLADSNTITDYRDRSLDYQLSGQHRTHNLTSYGTFELPFGAKGFLFGNSQGVLKKAVEGWHLSWVASMTSGIPGSIGAANRLWANGNPDLVAPQYWDNKSGRVAWKKGDATGRYWGNTYTKVVDPQCNALPGADTPSVPNTMYALCSGTQGLKAIALARDPNLIVFQHPEAGTRGNFQPASITGIGRWSLDMAMGKSLEFLEGKTVEFRVDAQNIFNHPTPSNSTFAWNSRFTQLYDPEFAMNSANPIGYISSKGGHRTFQARIRLNF
jgi:hypothetical protein